MKEIEQSVNKLQEYQRYRNTKEEINEYFTLILAFIGNITRDQNDIITYLTSIKNGYLPP